MRTDRWLGAVFGMTARMCVPNLATDPGIEEVLPIQNYWRAADLGRRNMVGWWDDHPLVATDDDQVKATAFVLPPRADAAANAEGLPSMVIALGNFRNHTVQVGLSGAVLAGRQLRAVAIAGFQAELAPFVASAGTLTIVAKRGWLLETVEPCV